MQEFALGPFRLTYWLDQRGQLLRAAVGFAGCSMPSRDRALRVMPGS